MVLEGKPRWSLADSPRILGFGRQSAERGKAAEKKRAPEICRRYPSTDQAHAHDEAYRSGERTVLFASFLPCWQGIDSYSGVIASCQTHSTQH